MTAAVQPATIERLAGTPLVFIDATGVRELLAAVEADLRAVADRFDQAR